MQPRNTLKIRSELKINININIYHLLQASNRQPGTIITDVMALCCIGGVCVPYSAVVPFAVVALQWLLGKLAAAGLLPPAVAHALARFIPGRTDCHNSTSSSSSSVCCKPASQQQPSNLRRSKISKQSYTATTTASCNGGGGDDDETATIHRTSIRTLDSDEELTTLLSTSEQTVVLKFTAVWCKPCKAIQPLFEQLANDHCAVATFAVVDADELDEAASRYGVVALPSFVACRGGKVVEKYAGSDETKLRDFCARVCDKKTM